MNGRTTLAIALVGASVFLAIEPVSAHHAMVAEFSVNTPITVRGTLTMLEWVNPHGWIHLDVKGPDGNVESWKFETGSPFRMGKQGLKRTDFRVGRELIVSGFASRADPRSGAGMTVTFADLEAKFPAKEASFLVGR